MVYRSKSWAHVAGSVHAASEESPQRGYPPIEASPQACAGTVVSCQDVLKCALQADPVCIQKVERHIGQVQGALRQVESPCAMLGMGRVCRTPTQVCPALARVCWPRLSDQCRATPMLTACAAHAVRHTLKCNDEAMSRLRSTVNPAEMFQTLKDAQVSLKLEPFTSQMVIFSSIICPRFVEKKPSNILSVVVWDFFCGSAVDGLFHP